MVTKASFTINPVKLRLVIRNDPRYKAYALRRAHVIQNAAIMVFNSQQRFDNEWRISETTPPKYVASFRIKWLFASLTARVSNIDPAWNLVEYGAHPGGRADVFVLRYRPLGRGLDIVAALGG